MIKFKTEILKFGEMGEKTGWTYIVISSTLAQKLKPGNKRSFRVKGKLDALPIKGVALLPMGEGDFIMPLNSAMRKELRKGKGDDLQVQLEEDKSEFIFDADLMICLEDEPSAHAHFKKLSGSHQKYFSKWISEAKTAATKSKRIAMAINALGRGWGFPEMLRAAKKDK